jgi:hypothetical protein
MTVAELIMALQQHPPDTVVLIERGEWGPSHITEARLTVVRDANEKVMNWEIYDPITPDDPDDRPRLTAVIID